MTLTLALILALQDSPAQVMDKVIAAVEKKDVKALSELVGDEVTEEDLKEADEACGGRYLEALKKGPKPGDVPEKAKEYRMRWAYAVDKGSILVDYTMKKVEGKWKLEDLDVDLRDQKLDGVGGKAKAPVADVLAGFVGAFDKKDWAKALEFAPRKVREKYDAAKLEKEFEKVEKELKGHFGEGLKSIPAVQDGADELAELSVGVAYDTPDGLVEAGVEFVKEDGAWVIGDFDIDLRKEDK